MKWATSSYSQRFRLRFQHSKGSHFSMKMVLCSLRVPVGLSDLSPEVVEQLRTEGAEILANNQNYIDDFLGKANIKFNGAMLGASGAIMGILAAFGVMYPNAELGIIFLPFRFMAKYFIPFYMAIEIFLGVNEFSWDNIAHFAHIGGAIVGFVLMMMWRQGDRVYRS